MRSGSVASLVLTDTVTLQSPRAYRQPKRCLAPETFGWCLPSRYRLTSWTRGPPDKTGAYQVGTRAYMDLNNDSYPFASPQ
ncbi:hypothetical protein BDV12DRAFT_118612 [Aspergillus spectabilis]